jgi:hypothetical protein
VTSRQDRQPLDVKPGDRVLFGKWSGTEVKLDGEDLLIMKESDIMGVLEAENAASRPPPDHCLNTISKARKDEKWLLKKSNSATRASACCAASTSSPTQ